jgi:predicted transcriptional regulator
MTKTALKNKLKKKIDRIDSQEKLKEVMRLVDLYSELDDIIKLSPAQKKALKKSMDDVKKGRVYSHSQVNKEVEKWLRT